MHLDNACEFTCQTFIYYCMLVGIDIKNSIAHTHTLNGSVESFIKAFN